MLRGSQQKSNSVSDFADVGAGDGDGERDGQELMERRSEAWLAVTEGGWMKTGVKGVEHGRKISPPARISFFTSPSQPSFTPSIIAEPMYDPVTGVGSIAQVEGGLLLALPDTDKGGVDG